MLISPPFLPERNAGETDADWLDRAMLTVEDGGFPVGTNCCWHGGVHLQAPQDGANRLPVRAIADGRVRFVRQHTPMPEDSAARDAHALGYEGWTSDGGVVIEHETDIGAAADGTAVTVRYYSIYQHLTEIPGTITAGRLIYRKDSIGEAGHIAGQPHRIHLEIVCDDANLQNLVGRVSGGLNSETDGRSDVVFGELYIRMDSISYSASSITGSDRAHHCCMKWILT
jgi:hydroxyethylthiazole kinase